MKAPAFEYARPASVEEAVALLARHGDEARVLAGGQSLMPMLNLRLLAPAVLVDINRVPGLDRIVERSDRIEIGALARHSDVLGSELVRRELPLLALALPHVAHMAVRNRGTHGGSLALADPAAELPACALALAATFVLRTARGERRVPAGEFFLGLYQTALQPDELLVGVEYPRLSAGWRFGFEEISRRQGDFAIAGLAAAMRPGELRLAYFGVSDRPMLVTAREALATSEVVGSDTYPAAYRRRLMEVLLQRVLQP